ncbi:hypothetical protein ACE4ZU_26740, partial [Salmonella enterica]|uniref:hypothetical protein n=1 Tax=Salmonella enterica TaxID=28901 RepID=UPI003D2DD14C
MQNGNTGSSLCSDAGNAVQSRHNADTTPAPETPPAGDHSAQAVASVVRKETANSIFLNVKKFAELAWEVDASVLPEVCRTI